MFRDKRMKFIKNKTKDQTNFDFLRVKWNVTTVYYLFFGYRLTRNFCSFNNKLDKI